MSGLGLYGIGPVCALGSGVRAFRRGLAGEAVPNICRDPAPAEWGEPCGDAGPALYYAPVVEGLDRFASNRVTRRLDSFSRQAVLAAFLALEDSGIEPGDKSRVGVVIGTGNGPLATTFRFLDEVIREGDPGASPTLFANSVHNAPASHISILLGLTGPCSTVTAFRDTVRRTFDLAGAWIEGGIVDYCVAGFGDEYCHVLGYALHELRRRRQDAESPSGRPVSQGNDVESGTERVRHSGRRPPVSSGSLQGDTSQGTPAGLDISPPGVRPFDFDHDTYIPGEGFTAFLLGRGAGKYGSIRQVLPGDPGWNDSTAGGPGGPDGPLKGGLSGLPELLPDAQLAVLSADGGLKAAGAFRKDLPGVGIATVSYVPLYGGMMTGGALDITAAALCLYDGAIYPMQDPTSGSGKEAPVPIGQGAAVVCVEHGDNGEYGIHVLRR